MVLLVFLWIHLLGFIFFSGSTNFGREMKPFALLFSVGWIMMETFDYALWRSREEGAGTSCYELVTVAGYLTVLVTSGALYAMIFYRRKGLRSLDDWDARVYFICALALGASLVINSELKTGLVPKDSQPSMCSAAQCCVTFGTATNGSLRYGSCQRTARRCSAACGTIGSPVIGSGACWSTTSSSQRSLGSSALPSI